MRSKTSFFNTGIAKNLLRRCWPLWTTYFAGILFILIATVENLDRRYFASDYGFHILQSGRDTAIYASFFVAVLAAMCMFSFLYSTRSCGMMTSLPVRRESMFMTAYLTGLLPLLAADVLAVLLAVLFTQGYETSLTAYLFQWLALVVMGNITFYGIAVFCAMLTGSLIILPAVYGVLNLAAWVAESCSRALMSQFVYGFTDGGLALDWLSPVIRLGNALTVTGRIELTDPVYLKGWGVIALYCAVGLLLSAAALLLYRRRNMETATDTVAFPILKPMFRYCMAVGTAIVFDAAVYFWLFVSNRWGSAAKAAVIILLLMAGAVIGYFAAEMLIQKTVRVFKGKWKGCVIVSLLMAVLGLCLELDVFGIERHVPKVEDVEYVMVNYYKTTLYEPENIERVTELHRQIILNKQRNETADDTTGLHIVYELKNGERLVRRYPLDGSIQAMADPNSDARAAQTLMNLPEAVANRNGIGKNIPLTPENLAMVRLECGYAYDEEGNWSYLIPADKAMSFVTDCLLPDVEDGTADYSWFVFNDDYYDLNTAWTVHVQLEIPPVTNADGSTSSGGGEGFYYSLQMNSQRCMRWIAENTDLDIRPLRADEKFDDTPRTYDARTLH